MPMPTTNDDVILERRWLSTLAFVVGAATMIAFAVVFVL